MSVINKLSSAFSRRDNVPNIQLATRIVLDEDKIAIKELVANLENKNKKISGDCVKVLYEVGERNPHLTAEYAKDIIALLDSSDNRMQWGAMTALSAITTVNPEPVYKALAKIVAVADAGSVITKDHCVRILICLGAMKEYTDDAIVLLMEQIQAAPVNQFPSYAEKALPLVTGENRHAFRKLLTSRLDGMEAGRKRSRVEVVIKKLK